jgi:hypothetical protein
VDNWKNITNSQNSVRKKSFGGTFSFSNWHIIGLDTGSLVLIVFGHAYNKLGSMGLIMWTFALVHYGSNHVDISAVSKL